MRDVTGVEPCGLTAMSTFAGCGGSSLGYRLAGFRVLWANEFVEAARESYAANMAPYTILDDRDIRTVDPAEVLKACGIKKGELDVLDGSPPCASFSLSGRRDKDWGKVKDYSDTEQRTDDLFWEYIRLVDGLRPKCFVAENVKGLAIGKAKGVMHEILRDMRALGYRVGARVLNASWLGVPQARERLIIIGVRNDLDKEPVWPAPLPYRYSIAEAIPWLRAPESGPKPEPETDVTRYATGKRWRGVKHGKRHNLRFNLVRAHPDRPCPTILASAAKVGLVGVMHPFECRKFSVPEMRRITTIPDDFVLTGGFEQQAERIGRCVPPVMMKAIAQTLRDEVLCKT